VNRLRLLILLPLTVLVVIGSHAEDYRKCPTAPKDEAKLPACSTEKVNRDCAYNIDRRAPIAMPTFQMHPGCHVEVIVYHPFQFETLSLVAGQAQAQQGSDQGSALVTAAIPNLKDLILGTRQVARNAEFMAFDGGALSPTGNGICAPADQIQIDRVDSGNVNEDKVIDDLAKLRKALKAASLCALTIPDRVATFYGNSSVVYAQLTDIQSSVPHPVANTSNAWLPGPSLGSWMKDYDPRAEKGNYGRWRNLLLYELDDNPLPGFGEPEYAPSGILNDTDDPSSAARILADLPAPTGGGTTGSSKPKSAAPNRFNDFDTTAAATQTDITSLTTEDLRKQYQPILDGLAAKEQQIVSILAPTATNLTKVEADLQTYLTNITFWKGGKNQTGITDGKDVDSDSPTNCQRDTNNREERICLGMIADTVSEAGQDKKLAPFKALAISTPYTVFAQNQITNSVLQVLKSSQQQTVVPITALHADPIFEVSSGAFISMMPNRSFANLTDVKVINGVPTPIDIRINESTSRPELLPFVAANWRIGRDYTMPDRRRGAVYGSLAVALNPYNTMPEFAGGLGFSWRNFMFTPLYHLGHDIHLTQGETVNQIWCTFQSSKNSSGVTTSSCVPISSPPAPTTKSFWRGAFAIGISIRIPTTFSSGNGGNAGGASGGTGKGSAGAASTQ
jgi:hypothetical protein